MSPDQQGIAEKFIQNAKDENGIINIYEFRDANSLTDEKLNLVVEKLVDEELVQRLHTNDALVRLTAKGLNWNGFEKLHSDTAMTPQKNHSGYEAQKIKLSDLPASLWLMIILISAFVFIVMVFLIYTILLSGII